MQAALSTLSEAEISALLAQLRSSSCSTQDLNASLARALLNYSNLNVPGIARQSSKLLPHSWSFTYSAPPSIDLKGKEVAAVSILIPSQGHTHSGCRYLIGNRIHEMLNAAVISLAFGLQLARPNKQSYTCGGLFDSTGRYEKLPVKDPRKAQTFCEPPCNFDRDIRRNKPPRMMSSTLALRLVNSSARFQAQEAAMTSWLPRARQKRLFAYGPHALYGKVFFDFFQFKRSSASLIKSHKGGSGGDRVVISVHLRHRLPCMHGDEIVDHAVKAVERIVDASKRAKCLLLVASDRRAAVRRMRNLTYLRSGCDVLTAPRRASSDAEAAAESKDAPPPEEIGVDVGVAAADDIELLSHGDHMVGTFGSTYTLLIQSLIAHKHASAAGFTTTGRALSQAPSSPTIIYCETSGCMRNALPLLANWHVSLQQWPSATLWVD